MTQQSEYVVKSQSDIEWNAFMLEIYFSQAADNICPATVFATANDVDMVAMRLSAQLPMGIVKLLCHSRIRCVYVAGVRSEVRDMKEFYDWSSADAYNATKFKDAKTAELI